MKGPTAANDIKVAIFKILESQPEECYNLLPLLLTQIYSSNLKKIKISVFDLNNF